MKCFACNHENDQLPYTTEGGWNDDAFISIGTTANIEEVKTVGYYRLHVNPNTKLFACPKCGTVRVKL